MHNVTVTLSGAGGFSVSFLTAGDESASDEPTTASGEEALDEGPSPIAPEIKELAWGLGAFVVFLVLMRYYLFPKVKQGMEARYGSIRGSHEAADATRAAANRDVAEYQAALAGVRKEAAARVDVARTQLESERAAQLAEVNARIAARREAASAEADAAKAAARDQVESAVADVTTRFAELAVGRAPAAADVRSAVSTVMSGGQP